MILITQVLDRAMSQKNPKIQSVSLEWLHTNLVDFGISGVNVKYVIEKVKLGFAATNPVSNFLSVLTFATCIIILNEFNFLIKYSCNF